MAGLVPAMAIFLLYYRIYPHTWSIMRLRIAHSTSYRYEPPATGVIQILRMTPGSHDGQYVA